MSKKYKKVEPDLQKPNDYKTIVNGYTFNLYNKSIIKACIDSNGYGYGHWNETSSYGTVELYSTEELACLALLHEIQNNYEKTCNNLEAMYINKKEKVKSK